MSFVEKFFAGAFGLVLVYLLVTNWNGVNGVLNGLADFNVKTFGVLQGRQTFVGG